jgi:RNase P subunit RPR2
MKLVELSGTKHGNVKDESETNSMNKNVRDFYRGINEFKKCYQPRNNLVKMRMMSASNSHNILNTWKNSFCHLCNVRWINDSRQTEIHTAEPLVLEPVCFGVQTCF